MVTYCAMPELTKLLFRGGVWKDGACDKILYSNATDASEDQIAHLHNGDEYHLLDGNIWYLIADTRIDCNSGSFATFLGKSRGFL